MVGGEAWEDLDGNPQVQVRGRGGRSPGEDFVVRYHLRERGGKSPANGPGVHGMPARLTVVSHDLEDFLHLELEPVAPREFQATLNLPRAVEYLLFFELHRGGARQMLHRGNLRMRGAAARAPALVETWRSASDGRFEVELGGAERLRAGLESDLLFRLRDSATGRGIGDLLPRSGAPGQVIFISEDIEAFGHAPARMTRSSPESRDRGNEGRPVGKVRDSVTELRVSYTFPMPGLYKLWLQLALRPGESHLSAFVVRIRNGGSFERSRGSPLRPPFQPGLPEQPLPAEHGKGDLGG